VGELTDISEVLRSVFGPDRPGDGDREFPLMPIGEAFDMGTDADGRPIVDPRIMSSAEFARNPYPYYRILRDHHPVFHDRLRNCYYVTRYDDITACYFDALGFNTIPKGSSNMVLGNTQLELSGIEHSRRRNLYGRHLVGAALSRRIGAIEAVANELIDRWFDPDAGVATLDVETGRHRVELGHAFADEFPIRVVCQVLGIPDDARESFTYWYRTMMASIGGRPGHELGLAARQHLEDFVHDIVEERRHHPTHLYDEHGEAICMDIISELCHAVVDGYELSTEEITSNIALVVGGGGETTRGAIMNMWYLLLRHGDQYESVLRDPGLWDAAFHETLRHSSSVGGQPRATTFDVELHGTLIPAGSLVHMVDFAANHDERRFADPERFDIHRTDLYTGRTVRNGYDREGRCNHMAFGVGPHLCPGAWISHQEATVGSRLLASRVADIRLDVPRMPKDIDGTSLAPLGLAPLSRLHLTFTVA
jgi:cytochrome P450